MIILAAALLLQAPGPVDEIVVTGRALEEPRSGSAYDMVRIDREALLAAPSRQLDELLKTVPGFQLFRRSDSRSANPTSQGATLRALGGNASSRALLLLDGVPQTDPFGGWIYWPAFDPRRLGGITVTRGGGAGASGPGALAGTIALRSAGPEALAPLEASLEAGSRTSMDARVSAAGRIGAGFASLAAHLGRGDGFQPILASQRGPVDRPAPYAQTSLAARALVPLGGAELTASGLLFSDERNRGLPFTGNKSLGADAALRLTGSRFSLLGYVQRRRFASRFAAANAARTAATSTLDQFAVPATGIGGWLEVRPSLRSDVELRVGGDVRVNRGVTRERFAFIAGQPTRGRVAGGESRTIGVFAEASWAASDALTLTGGARIDHWRLADGRSREGPLTDGPPAAKRFADREGWRPTGRAGLAYKAAGALSLRAAAYSGWRLPTLNELYRPFRLGPDATTANPALRPERLVGLEAGLDYRPLTAARLGVTVFSNRLEDAIANVTLGRGPGNFPGVGFVSAAGEFRQRRNLDAVAVHGAEAEAALAVRDWDFELGYSYADARVLASAEADQLDGLRPAQTPRHSASARLAWRPWSGARATLGARFVSGQFEDELNTRRLAPALSFEASASAPLTGGLSLSFRAENMTDERIEAAISSDGIVERATPRTLWLGLSWTGATRPSP